MLGGGRRAADGARRTKDKKKKDIENKI